MARPFPLQQQFNAGMKRDTPRNRMPPNSAWNLVDVIPDYDSPARERGGWAVVNSASAISAVTASASYIRGGIYAVFSPTAGEDPALLCLDEDGRLYEITISTGVPTSIGSARTIAQNPVFHGGTAASAATAIYTGLVIIPDSTLAAVPMKYDGTSLTALNGTPPKAKFATVYKDYLVLAHGYVGSTLYPNRAWYSPPGDPDCAVSGSVTAWDTTDSWLDCSLPIIGTGSTKNVHLFFHKGQITRVRGNTPPPDEDFVVDDPWQKIGLLDPFSITEYGDMIYWCAPEGVFRSDGVTVDNMALKGGMLKYWYDLVPDDSTSYTFATGIIREKLAISVMNGSTFVDAFLIDLNSYAWTRMSNVDAVSFWSGLYNSADELYFARRGATQVGRMDTIFQPDNSSYKNDGDGDAVASIIETPFYEIGRPGVKTLKAAFVGHTLTDHASDNPTVAVSIIRAPDDTSYESVGTLSENSGYERERIQIGGRAWGVGFKFTRANAGDLKGYDLSIEATQHEESKRL